jgi:hypothetical protein
MKFVALSPARLPIPHSVVKNYFHFAKGLATSRTQSRNVCTTRLTVRFFKVTIPTCQGRSATSIGKTLSENRSALKRSTEPDSAETKRLVASRRTLWWAE